MLSERIKELRLKEGISQAKLSSKLGLGKSMIGMIELGKRGASNETIKKIADYFDVSVDYLLGREASPTPNKNISKNRLVDDFLDELIQEKIITDPNNIDDETAEMILNAVKAEIALKLKKKNK